MALEWSASTSEPLIAPAALYEAYKRFEQAFSLGSLAEAQAALNYYEELQVAAGREMIPAYRIWVREGDDA